MRIGDSPKPKGIPIIVINIIEKSTIIFNNQIMITYLKNVMIMKEKCLRSRCVYPILMTNSNANNTDKIIELSIPWLEPRGRAITPRLSHKVEVSKLNSYFIPILQTVNEF